MRSLKTQTAVRAWTLPHGITPNKSVRLPVLLRDGTEAQKVVRLSMSKYRISS